MSADLAIKEPCRAATTANITLSGLQTIDGVSLAAADRVLVRAQSSAVNNGIYLAASGAWTRAGDFDAAGEVVGGTQVFVASGTLYGGVAFRVTGATPLTPGTHNIAFELAYDSDSITFQQAGSGAAARTVQSKLRESLSLAEFGYVADGSTDDTAAWQAAIAAAEDLDIRTILVPWGATGVSLVSGQIVNGVLPSGLTFEGEGRGQASDYETGLRLKYTGSGTCWFINHYTYTGEAGRWIWRNLGFEATDPEATMFDFNDVLNHGTVTDFDPEAETNYYTYLSHIRFESCFFAGPAGGAEQTGDAIRGAKLFHLVVDENCYIRGWRRGLYLKGCDNVTLAPRAFQNARNSMIEASGTFGNDARIDVRFFGGAYTASSEDRYLFWDSGNSSTYVGTFVEDRGANACTALFYLNGLSTSVIAPHFGPNSNGIPLFHLGPSAREAMILHPKLSVANATWAPIIDDPADTALGGNQTGYYATIVGAPVDFQRSCGVHPRLRYIAPQRGAFTPADQGREMLADARGYRPRDAILSALDYWDSPYGTPASNGIAEFVTDSAASSGWAMRLDKDLYPSGLAPRLLIGQDAMPGDRLRIRLRAKSSDGTNWAYITEKWTDVTETTGGFNSVLGDLSTLGASFTTIESEVDLTGFTAGQVLRIEIYNVGDVAGHPTAHADIVVDYLAWSVVTARAGALSWNPSSLADGAGETSSGITIAGAAFGDPVTVAAPYDLQGITCTAYVSAADTVKIRLQNETGGTIDLGSGTWKVAIQKDLL